MQKKIFDFEKKLNVFLFILLIFFSSGCFYSFERVAIEFDVPEWSDNWLYYQVIDAKGDESSDSILIENDGSCKIDLRVESPHILAFTIDKKNYPLLLVANPGGKISVSFNNEWLVDGSLESSRLIGFQKKILETEKKLAQIEGIYLDTLSTIKRDSIVQINTRIKDSLISELRKDAYWLVGDNPYDVSSIFILNSTFNNKPLLPYNIYKLLYHKVDSCMAVLYPKGTLSQALKRIIKYLEYEDSLNQIEKAVTLGSSLMPKQLVSYDGKLLQVPGVWAKWVLIDFWSPKHKSNGYEKTELKELYKLFSQKGLVIVSVGFGVDSADVAYRAAVDSLVWYQVAEPEWSSIATYKDWGIARFPSNLLIDRFGRVLAKNLTFPQIGTFIDSTLRLTVAKAPIKVNADVD